jgi:hypothetical protein
MFSSGTWNGQLRAVSIQVSPHWRTAISVQYSGIPRTEIQKPRAGGDHAAGGMCPSRSEPNRPERRPTGAANDTTARSHRSAYSLDLSSSRKSSSRRKKRFDRSIVAIEPGRILEEPRLTTSGMCRINTSGGSASCVRCENIPFAPTGRIRGARGCIGQESLSLVT